MPKILYFMPDNPLAGKAGNLTRAKQMLDYFISRHPKLEVDFFSVSDWGAWNDAEIEKFEKEYPEMNLYLMARKISKKKPLQSFFFYKIPNFFYKTLRGFSINVASFRIQNKIRELTSKKQYDFIVISYASWAGIEKGIRGPKPYLICDTHDFITAQHHDHQNRIGLLFQSELSILNKFDEIWTFSVEEEYIFGQFTNAKVTLVPISFPQNFDKHTGIYKYDIIFVASENPHNVAGIQWFLKNVLPKIPGINVHIIGKIGSTIKEHYPNVTIHGLVDDITEFYTHARMAICPMLSGTGIKIKVLEALSYGLPVVTNRRGVDGLKNKSGNGCLVEQEPQAFAEAIKKLLTDNEFYNQTKAEGISYFKNNHSVEQEQKILDQTFIHAKNPH